MMLASVPHTGLEARMGGHTPWEQSLGASAGCDRRQAAQLTCLTMGNPPPRPPPLLTNCQTPPGDSAMECDEIGDVWRETV